MHPTGIGGGIAVEAVLDEPALIQLVDDDVGRREAVGPQHDLAERRERGEEVVDSQPLHRQPNCRVHCDSISVPSSDMTRVGFLLDFRRMRSGSSLSRGGSAYGATILS